MKNLAKRYDPKSFEERIYKSWEEEGDFIADAHSDKPAYSVAMPPPNVTGKLHLGHAMNNTLQDILVRWKRMCGYETLWVPGTDHASISTEAKVVDKLKKEGKSKEEVGREKFIEACWDWTHEYGDNIRRQLRRLGISCDWSRERFTMDEGLNHAVYKVFKDLYEEGWIYRGDRIVNWCPSCGTAISDIEVEHEDEEGHLWYIRYPFKDDPDQFVTIATTRPETMLGDLAVAVNPEDDRYEDLVGKTLILPLVDREIPLIADSYVDMEYGTGAVKITPSHDPNDFEVGARHDLGQAIVIDGEAKIVPGYDPYSGMDRYEAREAMVRDLDDQGYLDHIEDLTHAVGHCERCGCPIEPLLSKQWFVKMDEYIKPAREAVENGDLTLVPEHFSKNYFNWIDNIHDWTISRQLWWGHRIPVWYCQDCDEIIVDYEAPEACPKCGSHDLVQDEDTLDTWFSSALWPFSIMGWPEETDDLKKFYPTNTLITGYDIIFFWVIRMVFSAEHFTGETPFDHVYFTGLIRDAEGRKMSKSLGNGVDPIEVIDKYGADALRFTLTTGNSPGNDTRYSEKKVEASRNFANKFWNASRFVLMNMEDGEDYPLDVDHLEHEDKWILTKLNQLEKSVNRKLTNFEIGLAAADIYDFTWNIFCDWYIEFVKPRLYGDDPDRKNRALGVLCQSISEIVRLLHPFMPFITEEIWQTLPFTEGKCIHAPFPQADEDLIFPHEERAIDLAVTAISGIRNERQQRNIAFSKRGPVFFYSDDPDIRKLLDEIQYEFINLASASEVKIFKEDEEKPEDAAVIVLDGLKIYIPLAGLVDKEAELKKLEKKLAEAQEGLERSEKKLANKGFTENAPEPVVQKERDKKARYEGLIPSLEEAIEETKKSLED